MMRAAKCLGVVLAVLLSAAELGADVVMHMKLPRRTYMCYEPVVAEVPNSPKKACKSLRNVKRSMRLWSFTEMSMSLKLKSLKWMQAKA